MDYESIAKLVNELTKNPKSRIEKLENGDYSLCLNKKELSALKLAFSNGIKTNPNMLNSDTITSFWF